MNESLCSVQSSASYAKQSLKETKSHGKIPTLHQYRDFFSSPIFRIHTHKKGDRPWTTISISLSRLWPYTHYILRHSFLNKKFVKYELESAGGKIRHAHSLTHTTIPSNPCLSGKQRETHTHTHICVYPSPCIMRSRFRQIASSYIIPPCVRLYVVDVVHPSIGWRSIPFILFFLSFHCANLNCFTFFSIWRLRITVVTGFASFSTWHTHMIHTDHRLHVFGQTSYTTYSVYIFQTCAVEATVNAQEKIYSFTHTWWRLVWQI